MADESTQYICGGCGRQHGWHCPYFRHPGNNMTAEEIAAARVKMQADKQAGVWPFNKSGAPTRPLQVTP